MAYSTGDVLSQDEVFDALITFMSGAGWSHFDTVVSGSRDMVMHSKGSDGKLNMYYRITSNNIPTGKPYTDPNDVHNRMPYLIVRGYHNWNAVTHSGSGEFGNWGPILMFGQWYSGTQLHYIMPFLKGDKTLATPISATTYRNLQVVTGQMINQSDGRRKMWTARGDTAFCWDWATGETFSSTSGFSLANPEANPPVLFRDPVTDKEYLYVMANDTVHQFLRFDIDAGTWQKLQQPPWLTSTAGGNLVCDGVDTIYSFRGNNTTQFAKYSISANTWTSLTAAPVSVAPRFPTNAEQPFRHVYVPASVSGLAEDVIYSMLGNTGTSIHRYDVTSNVWRTTTGTGMLTAPFSYNSSTSLFWDRQRYMYFTNQNQQLWYRTDLQGITAPGTWVTLGFLDATARHTEGNMVMNQLTCKLRCSNVIPGKYFFHGDQDSLRFVMRIGANPGFGRYYWMYLGKYDTNYRPQIMGITQQVTPGVRVKVNVDSTSGFNAGQPVTIANWSGSWFEKTTIYQISGSNAFICNLTSSFPSGSKIGVDPAQHILTGDHGVGITPMDAAGFETDLESNYYHVRAVLDTTAADAGAPSAREVFMPVPFIIHNRQNSANEKYENLGQLRNVFALHKKTFPSPQNEDVLVIGSDTYIYFNVQEMQRMGTDNRGIVIGPI